jgi:hypothetical protein
LRPNLFKTLASIQNAKMLEKPEDPIDQGIIDQEANYFLESSPHSMFNLDSFLSSSPILSSNFSWGIFSSW